MREASICPLQIRRLRRERSLHFRAKLEGNKLTVVWRNGLGFHSFVKYLNADAGENCRIDFDQTWDYKDSQKDGVPEVDPSQGATLADLMGK